MKNLFIILLTLFSHCILAQITPSPNALGTVTAGAEVDLFHGFVTETIPLHSVTSDNGYQVPVQLSYQTRGIRVQDIASSVGLGWNLTAGGAITRVMRDEPDDQSTFVNNPDGVSVKESQVNKRKGYDFEKDIFYYSFPSGGGSFISTRQASFVSGGAYSEFYGLPYTDNEIKFYYTNSNTSYWKITDTQGIQYVFGQSASAREITHMQQYEQGEMPEDNADFTFISTWYLEEIIFPDLSIDQSIKFSYVKGSKELIKKAIFSIQEYELPLDKTLWYYHREDGGTNFQVYKTHNSIYTIPMTGNVLHPDSPGLPFEPEYITGLYDYRKLEDPCGLNSGTDCLYTPKGDYLGDNIVEDPVHYEDRVEVFGEPNSASSETIFFNEVSILPSTLVSIQGPKSTVEFVHSMRIDEDVLPLISTILIKDHTNKTVVTYDLKHGYFDASDQDPICTSDKNCKRLRLDAVKRNGFEVASFQYITTVNLPSKEVRSDKALKIDRYGYYKSDVTSRYESQTFNQFTSENPAHQLEEAMMTVGPNNSREPNLDARANSLWKVTYPSGGVKEFSYREKESGGVAIQSVKVKNGDQVVSHSSYDYGDPVAMRSDMHALSGSGLVLLFSDSPYLTFDYMNSGGFYSTVVKNVLLNSSVRYTFYKSNLQDAGDKSRWSLRGTNWNQLEEEINKDNAPIMPPDYYPQHGLPELIQSYDEDGKIISEKMFYYTSESAGNSIEEHAFTYVGDKSTIYGSSKLFNVGKSILDLKPLQLSHITDKLIEDGVSIGSKTSYTYHPVFESLPRSVENYRIDGQGNRMMNLSWNDSKTVTYYPGDKGVLTGKSLPATDIISTLVTKNIVAAPLAVEQWTRRSDVLLDVSYATYKQQNGLIVPFKNYSSEFATPVTSWNNASLTEIGTSTYDNNGRLTSVTDLSGWAKSYAYDATGYLQSETVTAGLNSRVTSYTHLPLIGVETVTGPDGRTTTYEYDERNRLHLVRNHEGNILNRYRYNYASENEHFNAEIAVSGAPIVGSNVTFSVADLRAYGGEDNTKMYWSISKGSNDGAIIGEPTVVDELYSGEGKTASVILPEAGDYLARLSLVNPEYDEPKVIYKPIVAGTQYWDIQSVNGSRNIQIYCSNDGGDDDPSLGGDGGLQGGGSTINTIQAINSSSCTYPTVTYSLTLGNGVTSCGAEFSGLSYQWEYKYGSNWTSFGSSSSGTLPESLYNTAKTIQVRCLITDPCGDTKISDVVSVSIQIINQ